MRLSGLPKLDWVPRHDERSRQYDIRAVIPRAAAPARKLWDEGPVLDQGAEGACVGFGWTAELLAAPKARRNADPALATLFAKRIYNQAKRIDEWAGENYDGTSVLAGAKVVKSLDYITEYRWCFTTEDVRTAVIAEGPVVIGVPWLEGMYETRPSGLVEVTGRQVGGHCITLTGYHPKMRIKGEGWLKRHEVFRWRNSWGPTYGLGGSGFIKIEDLDKLLKDNGEACVPMGRKDVPAQLA